VNTKKQVEPKQTIHAWITTHETDIDRTQRKVACLRSYKGLAITHSGIANGFATYTITHLASGRRVSEELSAKQALSVFDELAELYDWTVPNPVIRRADLVRFGLVAS